MSESPDVQSRVSHRRIAWFEAAIVVARAALTDPDREPAGGVRRAITAEACRAADADVTSLILPTREPGELTNIVSVGLGAEVYQDVTFLARDSALGRAVVAGEPVIVDQILPWATDHADPPNPFRLGPAMTLPLHDAHGANAALVLSRTVERETFGADEQRLAAPFAELADLALRHEGERAAAINEQQRLARERAVQVLHDELSQGLFALGVGLQSVIDLGGDPEAHRRLRSHLADLDDMIGMLRKDAQDPSPPTGGTSEHG